MDESLFAQHRNKLQSEQDSKERNIAKNKEVMSSEETDVGISLQLSLPPPSSLALQ